MTRTSRFSLAALLLVAATSAAQAQSSRDSLNTNAKVEAAAVAAPQTAPEAKKANVGPTMESASVGVKTLRAKNDPAPLPPRAETRQNQAMMIVGFGGMIAGAVIGGDAGTIVMIGGAVVGLIGLYRYLE
jgi:hypothetical protein